MADLPGFCRKFNKASTKLIEGKALDELASMVRVASGTHGSCVEYVADVATKLSELGIDDPAVVELRKRINEGHS